MFRLNGLSVDFEFKVTAGELAIVGAEIEINIGDEIWRGLIWSEDGIVVPEAVLISEICRVVIVVDEMCGIIALPATIRESHIEFETDVDGVIVDVLDANIATDVVTVGDVFTEAIADFGFGAVFGGRLNEAHFDAAECNNVVGFGAD